MLHATPTQLHLNSWVLSGRLRCFATSSIWNQIWGVFFSHFKWKRAGKGGWLSLNNIRGKGWLKLFDNSYKHFKSSFFKVSSTEDKFPFFLNDKVHPRFPLFWQRGLTVLPKIDCATLDPEGQVLVDLLSFSPQLKSVKLIELGIIWSS